MKRTITALLFSMFILSQLPAQELETWLDSQRTILYEKIYLHIDRELYSPGDYIWFKTYLVNGFTNQLLPGYKNIFVQLVNNDGKVFYDRIILSQEGISHGDFLISDSIPDGAYVIRAYTKYLENFDEESYFHKEIRILRDKRSTEVKEKQQETNHKIDVSFWPESGNLILNAPNFIAFKAIDQSGKGVDVCGSVVDENDTVIATFKTSYLGMGQLIMMPQEQKSYSVRISGYPGFSYRFGNIQEEGIALHYSDEGENVLFVISRNIKKAEKQQIYFIASHKGIVLFYKKIELEGFNQALKTGKNIFPLGISKITLIDADFNELAERLVFIRGNDLPVVKLQMNKNKFTSREKAEVRMEMSLDDNDTLQQTLSVAVVDRNYLNAGGENQSINSYLLLDSELKGPVESPASFFTDNNEISSSEKLDLLMMVHGWRSYYWSDLNKSHPENLTGWNDAGITVEGYVRALFKNKPVVGGKVVLGPFSRNLLFEETNTDSLGRFRFDRLYLRDSALIILNAKNEKDRANTEIVLDPVFPFQPVIPSASIRNFINRATVPMKFNSENNYRQLNQEEFSLGKGSILLNEVVVTARRKEKEDGHFRIYSNPDAVLKITEDDYTYMDILDYLEGKVAGLVISGDQISIRGGGMPMFLLDGVEVEATMFNDLVLHTRMSDIDKIEVLKTGVNMAMFGSKGGNGVIAIYTKKGDVEHEIRKYVKGQITQRVRGFRNPAQFYSPRYSLENINDPTHDYRPTLFWEPDLHVVNGSAKFDFFTSDELSEYSVIVEGISKNGKICSATENFLVTGFYNRDN